MASEQVFNINFVAEIEKRPELYDYTLTNYSRKDITEKAWTEVSERVGMTVGECKERWKNLRAVFARHLKPGGSALKRKKPYYLQEAMQFALPFIKSFNASSGNMPEVFKPERYESGGNSDNEDNASGQNQNSQSPESIHTSRPTPSPPLLPTVATEKLQEQGIPTELHITSKDVRHDAVDNPFAEHLAAKKAKLSVTKQSSSSRTEALRMFLLSMLPDLESMTEVQVRQFKRKCLDAIDDIFMSPSYPSPTPATTTTVSSLSSCQRDQSSVHQPLCQSELDATKRT